MAPLTRACIVIAVLGLAIAVFLAARGHWSAAIGPALGSAGTAMAAIGLRKSDG